VWPRRVVPAPTSAVSMPHNCGAAMRCVSKAGPGYNGAFARTELASSLSKSARYVAVAPIPPAVWIAIVSSIVVVVLAGLEQGVRQRDRADATRTLSFYTAGKAGNDGMGPARTVGPGLRKKLADSRRIPRFDVLGGGSFIPGASIVGTNMVANRLPVAQRALVVIRD
jgi:hypothetical protein